MATYEAMNDAEIAELEQALAKEPEPDVAVWTIDGRGFSPRQMFDAMKAGTPIGRELVEAIRSSHNNLEEAIARKF